MVYLFDNILVDIIMCLVYGDFWIGNLLFNCNSKDVVVVLDWELFILGYLLVDLVYCCIFYYLL